MLAAATVYVISRDSDEPLVLAAGEVFLEPADQAGPDPFTTEIDTEVSPPILTAQAPVLATTTTSVPTTTTSGTETTTPPTVGVPSVSGATPGLYGGTQNQASCDPGQLVSFLQSEPEKAAAWVAGINADSEFSWSGGDSLQIADIPAFVAELTPIILTADTRVTNNGYRDGQPTPRQAVLQAGTAVMVDSLGVPRFKCNCGNPLSPPVAQTVGVSYVGDQWSSFDPATTVVVQPAPAPMGEIQIVDVNTGELIARPVGSTGSEDRATGLTVSEPLVEAVGATASSTTSTQATTTQASDTTTTTLLVLTSDDYCAAWQQWSVLDSEYYNRYENPEAEPEYLSFLDDALTDLANLAPPEIRDAWVLFRDTLRTNPDLFFNYSDRGSTELDNAALAIFEHLEAECGEAIFDG